MNKQQKRSSATWIWDFAGEYRPKYILSALCGILPYFVIATIIANLLGGCHEANIYLKN